MQRGESKNEKLPWTPYECEAPQMVGNPLE